MGSQDFYLARAGPKTDVFSQSAVTWSGRTRKQAGLWLSRPRAGQPGLRFSVAGQR